MCNAARDCRRKYSASLQAGSETDDDRRERETGSSVHDLEEFEQGGPVAQVREAVDGVLELEGG